MDDFKSRVAVVTGGASGIGFGVAMVLSRAGAHVVLADIVQERIDRALAGLTRATGGRVLGVATDVSDHASVEALADAAYSEFGAVNLLFNNAGATSVGRSWETPLEDWRRVLDVNLLGCVHGIRAFIPRMLAGGQAGYVVNTASMAGLLPMPLKAPYTASKYAIVGLSQALSAELRSAGADIGVAVACPGAVATTMAGDLVKFYDDKNINATDRALLASLRSNCAEKGIRPEEAGEMIVEAIRHNRFWVWPNGEEFVPMVERNHHFMMSQVTGQHDPSLTAVGIDADR